MRITVNPEKQEEIFFSSGLVSDRVVVNNILKYFLWSFTSRGQRLRALFLFSCCCFPSSSRFSLFFGQRSRGIKRRAKKVRNQKEKRKKNLSKDSSVIPSAFSWSQRAVRGGSSRDQSATPLELSVRPSLHGQHAQTPSLLQMPRMLWSDPYGCPA